MFDGKDTPSVPCLSPYIYFPQHKIEKHQSSAAPCPFSVSLIMIQTIINSWTMRRAFGSVLIEATAATFFLSFPFWRRTSCVYHNKLENGERRLLQEFKGFIYMTRIHCLTDRTTLGNGGECFVRAFFRAFLIEFWLLFFCFGVFE